MVLFQTIMGKRTQQNKDFFNSLAKDWDARQKLSDDDVFNLVKLANINPGDKVLVPDPGYPTYTSASMLAGADIAARELLTSTC